MKFYTGIGSRETPFEIQELMVSMARILAKKGYVLRSGAVPGADYAFEAGCDKENGNKEIFLPWRNFQGSSSGIVLRDKKSIEIAKSFHPHWNNLNSRERKLHARNIYQILGKNLMTPSSFVICYTVNGYGGGATGQAVRIARAYNVPVFDCGAYEHDDVELLETEYKNFLKINNF